MNLSGAKRNDQNGRKKIFFSHLFQSLAGFCSRGTCNHDRKAILACLLTCKESIQYLQKLVSPLIPCANFETKFCTRGHICGPCNEMGVLVCDFCRCEVCNKGAYITGCFPKYWDTYDKRRMCYPCYCDKQKNHQIPDLDDDGWSFREMGSGVIIKPAYHEIYSIITIKLAFRENCLFDSTIAKPAPKKYFRIKPKQTPKSSKMKMPKKQNVRKNHYRK